MRTLGTTFLSAQMYSQDAIRRQQSALAKAQVELASQRHSDMLMQLSDQTGRNIRWHSELESTESNIRANDFHDAKSDIVQTSLKSASTIASEFLSNLIGSRGAEGGREIVRSQATNMLAMLEDALNVDVDGVFLFSGRNQDVPPLAKFEGSAGQAQFDAAFFAEFGMTQSDPAVSGIGASQMETFLNGNLATMFDSPNWESTISSASGSNVRAQVAKGVNVDVLANANEKSIRELYAAIASVSEIAVGDLNDAAFKKLVDFTASKVSSAVQGLADIQARVGLNQKTLADANEQLKSKKNWLNEIIQKTESVDTYEVATRINGLMTQLEASYSVTGRISRISLLNYL